MLTKLYEAVNVSSLENSEFLTNLVTFNYIRSLDCAVYFSGLTTSVYKVYRDGSFVRYHSGRGYYYQYAYWHEQDCIIYLDVFNGAQDNVAIDRLSMILDLHGVPHPLLTANVSDFQLATTVWNNHYYRPTSSTVEKRDVSGSVVQTISLTGSQTFVADRAYITQDGILTAIDFDNGTYAVVRFYNLLTSTMMHEAVFDRSHLACVDTVNNQIWSLKLADKRMQVWSFNIAPQNFSAITMSANRARYREDTLSVTLRGSINEPVPNWPVSWSLTTGEGRLEKSYTVTDASGVATNRYFGPGVDDYVGGTQTITVSTGY